MSGIRGTDTRPELLLRSGLHKRGFRYRLHCKALPGKPDLVFPKFRAVIFVNGCFWHHHDCHLFKWPKSRAGFWRTKINGNRDRDLRNCKSLSDKGWRIATVWECALKGKEKKPFNSVLDQCTVWLKGDGAKLEVTGNE